MAGPQVQHPQTISVGIGIAVAGLARRRGNDVAGAMSALRVATSEVSELAEMGPSLVPDSLASLAKKETIRYAICEAASSSAAHRCWATYYELRAPHYAGVIWAEQRRRARLARTQEWSNWVAAQPETPE